MEVKKIVKLTNDQYSDLLINGEIIVDGEVKHWEDDVLYISDSALETVELRNKIDKGLIKPNKLTHTQYITPKVRELIKNVEYEEGMRHIPDYEWNYVVIKGKMTNGDYIRYLPVGNDNFGKAYIWNNAEWQELTNDYECTSDDEEDVMLKVYASVSGYDAKMTLSRNSFNFKIDQLGVHTTSENINDVKRYSTDIDVSDLLYVTKELYMNGNFELKDTKDTNEVTRLIVDGYLSYVNFVDGFTGLIYIEAIGINVINNLWCPHLKRIDVKETIGQIKLTTIDGHEQNYLKYLENIPKAISYETTAFAYVGLNAGNYKEISAIFDYPCSFTGSSIFTTHGISSLYLGESVNFLDANYTFQYGKLKNVSIYCKTVPWNCFASNSKLTTVFISNNTESFSNSFNYCSDMNDVVLEEGFNATGLNLSVSTKYSIDTMLQWIAALKDNSGTTAKTLQIGTVNWNKFKATKISYAEDLGRWEFDTGFFKIDYPEINKPYRVSSRPQTLNRVYDFSSGNDYSEGVDYIFEDGFITIINENLAERTIAIDYTTTATLTPQIMVSQKNWTIS